jgi:hypothetical protein
MLTPKVLDHSITLVCQSPKSGIDTIFVNGERSLINGQPAEVMSLDPLWIRMKESDKSGDKFHIVEINRVTGVAGL